jgi:glycosyltransferase involved in cell wall biosynthesis
MSSLRVFFTPQFARNPYQRQLADNLQPWGCEVEGTDFSNADLYHLISKHKPDILHIHWPSFFFIKDNGFKSFLALILFVLKLVTLKLFAIKIVWTVHNLKDHENPYPKLDKMCNLIVAKLADGIIAHCEVAKDAVIENLGLRNGKDKVFVIPHGHYLDCYENKIDRLQARHRLKVDNDKLVILFLGKVRPYKGVFELIESFTDLNIPETQLIIAGKPVDEAMKNSIKKQISGAKNIEFIPDFIPDEQIQIYMNACDAVIFPYRDILTSGAIILAMSFAKACIAPRKGCIGELLDDMGSFLYDGENQEGLGEAIKKAVTQKHELLQMGEHNLQLAQKLAWSGIAEQTFRVYNTIYV